MQHVSNKINILFILPWLPFPLTSGGRQAVFNGIVSIKDDYNVFIAYRSSRRRVGEDKESFLAAVPNATLFPFIPDDGKITLKAIRKFITYKISFLLRSHRKNAQTISEEWLESFLPPDYEWIDFINGICLKHKFDIIQVEMPWLISQVYCLPENSLKVYVHHELGFVIRQLQVDNFIEKGEATASVVANLKCANTNEISLLNQYDLVITLSRVDADKLYKAGVTKPIRPSFAVVNTERPLVMHLSDGKTLTFVGADSHMPNLRGVEWFLENCWLKLKSIDHEYKLKIIGNWSISNIERLEKKYENIQFLGFVDDLQEALAESIMIVPILEGSGIRMKILEACSFGVPFVSTRVGAEGIPVVDGENCYIADSADCFVTAIVKLGDKTIQRDFAKNSYDMVKKYYSIKALGDNRRDIYNEILS